jgi:hypothetical protein
MKPTPQDRKRDIAFRLWVNKQPCYYCARQGIKEPVFSEYVNGEGRNPAAHVNRANNRGVSTKALLSAIPLCKKHHDLQHLKGETALMPKAEWDEAAKSCLKTWVAL